MVETVRVKVAVEVAGGSHCGSWPSVAHRCGELTGRKLSGRSLVLIMQDFKQQVGKNKSWVVTLVVSFEGQLAINISRSLIEDLAVIVDCETTFSKRNMCSFHLPKPCQLGPCHH